jgi:hypothetical protein
MGLFGDDAKNDQFPDAFIFEVLKAVAKRSDPLTIVSDDKDFAAVIQGAGHISRLKSIPDLFADLGFTIEAAPDVEDFVEDNLDELVATVHDELNQWGLQVNDVNVLIGLAFDPQSAPKADPHLVRPKCAEPFQNSPLRRDQCWKPKGVKIRSRDTCHNSANTPQT